MNDEKTLSFKDLEPWQLGIALAERVHGATAAFPPEGDELGSRMRDAVIAIPSSLSEAFALESTEQLVGVVAPMAELETCVELARRLDFLAVDLADDMDERIEGIMLSIGRALDAIDPDLGEAEDGDYPGRPRQEIAPRQERRGPPPRGREPRDRGPRDRGRSYDDQRDCEPRPYRRYHPDDWY